VTRAEEGESRGEWVIVLAGRAEERVEATDETIEASLKARLDAGDDRKQAVAGVVAELGVPKRRVYDTALRLKRA
jgi:16S rRNA (cytidine1402-2'-O)-methyltransferase